MAGNIMSEVNNEVKEGYLKLKAALMYPFNPQNFPNSLWYFKVTVLIFSS
jgi:hypothetical protein